MKTTRRTKLDVAIAAATTTALLGAAVTPTAQAADRDGPKAHTIVNAGIPSTVDPANDLAAHTPDSDPAWSESIYFTSWVKGNGHDFGLVVQTATFPHTDQQMMTVAVTDVTTGWHKSYQTPIAKEDYNWSKSGLDIRMPGMTWTGTALKMSVRTATPWGSLDVQLRAKGPALKVAGTGSFPLLGKTNYEYAFPSMQTTGTLNIQDKSYKVSGESWLDKQWGPVAFDDSMRWTWMNFRLPGGDKMVVWDSANRTTENAWATVLHPDGSYDVVAVEPVAEGAHRIWTSPTTGNAYPTRWSIDIPALKTHLNVRVTGTDAQEVTGDPGSRYEATAAYQGKKVSGVNYAEMVGHWPA
ncbi:hypothetical protein SGFS_022290 [Streptomyces graminofaciens]|uniref:AttH domain-containing protein n=1 Tax=Streptomyces graminofaciens TaxID=68212 RepID=A0ABM7F5A5_9ACTN|nr:lipocalin-like domain-containing protein [Streptomyces graminofaciens]BBC30935.1 hypothetical protein SGFS_022290 [Streptomyces graminofaciens]